MQNEDIEYLSSDIPSANVDEESNNSENVGTLKRVLKYLNASIEAHNSLDGVNYRDKTFTARQQIAINKQVVEHLRNMRSDIINKLEEGK